MEINAESFKTAARQVINAREAVLELLMNELDKRPSYKDKYLEWLDYEPRTSVEMSKAIIRLRSLPEEI